MPIKVTSRLVSRWVPKKEKEIDAIALRMATDVHRFGSVLAPKDSGNLVSSGRIERLGQAAYKVLFGGETSGFSVPYAKIRHFVNKKSPHTLKYLERAGKAVAKNKAKYVKGEKPAYK